MSSLPRPPGRRPVSPSAAIATPTAAALCAVLLSCAPTGCARSALHSGHIAVATAQPAPVADQPPARDPLATVFGGLSALESLPEVRVALSRRLVHDTAAGRDQSITSAIAIFVNALGAEVPAVGRPSTTASVSEQVSARADRARSGGAP